MDNSRFFKDPSAVIYVDWRDFGWAESFCIESLGRVSTIWNYYYISRSSITKPRYVKSQGYYFEFNNSVPDEFLVEFTMRFAS